MKQLAQGIASLGRGDDTMLVHMSPIEVKSLQAMAQQHGGSLTINPHTGLPEAGFLSAILPIAAGIVGNMILPGIGGALGAGLASYATDGQKLMPAVLAGVGAYGMSGIGDSLDAAGAASGGLDTIPSYTGDPTVPPAGGIAPSEPSTPFEPPAGGMPGTSAAGSFYPESPAGTTAAAYPSNPGSGGQGSYGAPGTTSPVPTAPDPIFGSQKLGNIVAGAQQPGALSDALLSKNGLMAGVGLLGSGLFGNPLNSGTTTMPNNTNVTSSNYVPITQGYNTNAQFPTGARPVGSSEYNYFPTGTLSPNQPGNSLANYNTSNLGLKRGGITRLLASGGSTDAPGPYAQDQQGAGPYGMPPMGFNEALQALAADVPQGASPGRSSAMQAAQQAEAQRVAAEKAQQAQMLQFARMGGKGGIGGLNAGAAGGAVKYFATGGYNTPVAAPVYAAASDPLSADAFSSSLDNNYYGQAMAAGGVPGDHPVGGMLLKGPGDGTSDDIPAVINGHTGQTRAALADNEFVVPADVVAHLGNGSSDAGARKLYGMLDRVRKAKTGKKEMPRDIPNGVMPA